MLLFEALWKLTLKCDFSSPAFREGLGFDRLRNQSPRTHIHPSARKTLSTGASAHVSILLLSGLLSPDVVMLLNLGQPDARGSHVWQSGTVRSMLSGVRSHFCGSELGASGSRAMLRLWVCRSQRRRRTAIA